MQNAECRMQKAPPSSAFCTLHSAFRRALSRVCFGIAMLGALGARQRPSQTPPAFSVCDEGSGSFQTLTPVETDAIVKAATAALNVSTATIAVVDRAGNILALFRQPAAGAANDDQAVGVARTAAFFSHNMAPLSSRTVRFISGVHFPPG